MMTNAEKNECARACAECAEICLESIALSLALEGARDRELAVQLEVCAQICRTTEASLRLGSQVYQYACLACAAICEHCAADGEDLGDRRFEDCVEACLECAEQCRKLATDTGSTALSA